MAVEHDDVDAAQTALLQPGEKFPPTRFGFAIPKHQPKNLTISLVIHADGNQSRARTNASVFPNPEDQGIDEQKRIAVLGEASVVPRLDDWVKAFAQVRNRRFRKGRATQLLRKLGHISGRHAVHHHLHQGEEKSLLATLIPNKKLG